MNGTGEQERDYTYVGGRGPHERAGAHQRRRGDVQHRDRRGHVGERAVRAAGRDHRVQGSAEQAPPLPGEVSRSGHLRARPQGAWLGAGRDLDEGLRRTVESIRRAGRRAEGADDASVADDPLGVATPVAVPLTVPTRIATREVLAREFVLVEMTTDDGARASATPTPGRPAPTLAAFIDDYFAPRLVGEPALAPERVWAALFQEHLLIGRRGFLLRALSAVDIALWDLVGKVAGPAALPAARRLPRRRARPTPRRLLPARRPAGEHRDGVTRYLKLGFTDFKIKVGGAPLDVDVERVRVAREMIGPRARLGLDANNAWRTPSEASALRAGRREVRAVVAGGAAPAGRHRRARPDRPRRWTGRSRPARSTPRAGTSAP